MSTFFKLYFYNNVAFLKKGSFGRRLLPFMASAVASHICTVGSLLGTEQDLLTFQKLSHLFTIFDGDDKLFDALSAGARSYLLKNERGATIIKAIEELVGYHGAPMSSSIARKALNILINSNAKSLEAAPLAETTLSPREIEILKGLVNGLDYKQLAFKLLLSPNTIRNHIAAVYTKLHICSKAQAITMAIKNKWV